ncbi:MAG: hydroxymethylglutaryl-CoA lyase [Legionellales bacterium]|nr:hydroxymethylglutaryl-CoA lyase [Legionellales bacterium]|tara:strand:- start:965 stop:1861 length:897 start_codon:yes stop_codon:yes gene_type:complete
MRPDFVKLIEVGPRDGLQNEKQFIPTEIKISLIDKLSQTGLSYIETTSFVSPKSIPQMADAKEVITHINPNKDVTYGVLVPNVQGMQLAIAHQVKEISIFTTVSETFCQKNINCSITESLERYKTVIHLAQQNNIKIRGYISCVVGCPYEGKMSPLAVTNLAETLLKMGCYQISLGDTIGIATPGDIKKLLYVITAKIPVKKLAVHFHDTYGQALVNIYEALHWGIATVDTSVAGLGGCPYAKGASGNVATEDVIYMLNGLDIKTGVSLDAMREASIFISEQLHRPPYSKVTVAQMKE